MATLTCEICGGKLIGKPGDVFECDSCGMEYDTAWAKQKIQEIKGTVQVEGTVKVQGTVQVDTGRNVTALLKRGKVYLEDREWDAASECFRKVLDLDPECAEAYLYTALSNARAFNEEAYWNTVDYIPEDKNVIRALMFANAKQRESWEDGLNRQSQMTQIRMQKKEDEARRIKAEKDAEEQRIQEEKECEKIRESRIKRFFIIGKIIFVLVEGALLLLLFTPWFGEFSINAMKTSVIPLVYLLGGATVFQAFIVGIFKIPEKMAGFHKFYGFLFGGAPVVHDWIKYGFDFELIILFAFCSIAGVLISSAIGLFSWDRF